MRRVKCPAHSRVERMPALDEKAHGLRKVVDDSMMQQRPAKFIAVYYAAVGVWVGKQRVAKFEVFLKQRRL